MVEPFEEFGFGVRPKGPENRTEPNFPTFSFDPDNLTMEQTATAEEWPKWLASIHEELYP
jgi:hypothetical protein